MGLGNRTKSTVQNPIYTYQQPGNYTVNLTVRNAYGSNSTNQTIQVNKTFLPDPNGYRFVNFGSTFDLTPDDFYDVYGIHLDLSDRARKMNWFYRNYFEFGGEGGNCFGFTSTSIYSTILESQIYIALTMKIITYLLIG